MATWHGLPATPTAASRLSKSWPFSVCHRMATAGIFGSEYAATAALVRSITAYENTVQETMLAVVEFMAGLVHRRSVIDQQYVAKSPFMMVDEFRLQRRLEQFP